LNKVTQLEGIICSEYCVISAWLCKSAIKAIANVYSNVQFVDVAAERRVRGRIVTDETRNSRFINFHIVPEPVLEVVRYIPVYRTGTSLSS
jgi:hypothetical protein